MIYFIQVGEAGPIKIGFIEGVTMAQVEQRLAFLQTGNAEQLILRGTMPGDLYEERQLHERFADGRLRGEWFHPSTPGLQGLIDSAPNDAGEIDWRLRSDAVQICEWCKQGVVIPPRRTLCSDRCATEKKIVVQRHKKRLSKAENPGTRGGFS